MPRLPTSEQLGQRPTPSVRGGIAPLRLQTPRQGQEAAAFVELGQAVKGLGDTMAMLAQKEKQEVDEARYEEAFTNYQNGLLGFELDEKEGFANILNGDAVKRPLKEEYQEKRKALRDTIRKGLANDDQRVAFERRADIADRQFDARLYRHVADQSRSYQGIVSEGLKATERRMAALYWDQPGQIEMSILRTNMEVERKARRDGLDPAREGDRQTIDTLKAIAETQIHSDVIDQMILQGRDTAASAYYERIRERLTPEALTVLGMKVDKSSIEGEAIRGADLAWEALGPQGLYDTVRLDQMEAAIRDQYRDNPETMKAAIADIRSRAIAHGDARREFTATNKAKVLDAFEQGADMRTLVAMPEYQALQGDDRVQVRDYISNSGWTAQQRARAEAQYMEGAKASAGFQRYWELSNPTTLASLSEAEILALRPELGTTLTEDLMKAKRKLSSPDAIKAATIDDDLFKVLASQAGLDPYAKTPSPEKKEYLGRLRNQVEASIDAAQQQLGRKLTRDETQKIMQSEIDNKVMVDEWGRDPSLPAAVIKPEQRQNVYVPITEIDQQWLRDAANYMRSIGAVPSDWSDEKIRQARRGRLERAYAISITGGTSEEGRAALEGRE